MTNRDIVLDQEVIREFESALFDVVPAYEDHLAPGLTTEEIRILTSALPGHLPKEAKTWWAWRNGIDESIPQPRPEGLPFTFGDGELRLSSLEECVSAYWEERRRQPTSAIDEDLANPVTWFPLDFSVWLSIELCEDADEEVARVIASNDYFPDEVGLEAAPTLGRSAIRLEVFI